MFGVLVVIFRGDWVATLGFSSGLEPPTNVEPHGGSGKPSFWERPCRALPDRKGSPRGEH